MLSRSLERQLGYGSSDLVGSSPAEAFGSQAGEALKQYFSRLRKGEATKPVILTVAEKDSRAIKDLSWSCHWSENDQCFFCVAHDISSELEKERLKARFVNIVNKQLRTPLSKIQENLKSIDASARDTLSQKGVKSLSNSLKSSGRIVQLVDELLELEKMESGVLKIQIADSMKKAKLKGLHILLVANLESFHFGSEDFAEQNSAPGLELHCFDIAELADNRFDKPEFADKRCIRFDMADFEDMRSGIRDFADLYCIHPADSRNLQDKHCMGFDSPDSEDMRCKRFDIVGPEGSHQRPFDYYPELQESS